MVTLAGVLWLAIWCWLELKNFGVNLLGGVKYPNMKTLYNFAIYETPEKYHTFTVRGKEKYSIMSNKLRKYGYWFTVSYTPIKERGGVLDVSV